jgi:hypothetical protein
MYWGSGGRQLSNLAIRLVWHNSLRTVLTMLPRPVCCPVGWNGVVTHPQGLTLLTSLERSAALRL